LVELRKRKGITQGDVAKVLKIPRSTYSNYELGNREPDFDTTEKLAQLFNVSVDYLLGRADDPLINLSDDAKKILDIADLIEKHGPEVEVDFDLELDGKILSKEELLRFIAFLRTERQMKDLL
jgi:transcriptional regulator with XRE-family HTH domain